MSLRFSVIVPTYNRPLALQRCLQALTRQDYLADTFEVIVVDDGGNTPLDALVASFEPALRIKLVKNSHGGPSRARNTGARHAREAFLAFTDDDCEPASGWLTALAGCLKQFPTVMAGGAKSNTLRNNPYSAATQFIEDSVYAHYNAEPDRALFFASNNIAMPAEQFATVGGFDEGFRILACEDREFCDRWLHHSLPMRYVPQAVVYHSHPLTLFEFCRQFFTFGRGALHFYRIRAQRNSGSVRRELRFHLNISNWLSRPWRTHSRWQAAQLSMLLMVWQLANLTGFIYESLIRTGYQR